MAQPSSAVHAVTAAHTIASTVVRLHQQSFPFSPSLYKLAARHLADTLACALAANNETIVNNIKSLIVKRNESGPASVWGTNIKTTTSNATFINTFMIRHLDANDLYIPPPEVGALTGTHASDAIGGVIAAAEQAKHTICGRKLLGAVILAYEIPACLSPCLYWIPRGIHTVAQCAWATPVAVGYLLNSPYEHILHGFCLAGSTNVILNSWLKYDKVDTPKSMGDSGTAVADAAVNSKQQVKEEGVPTIKSAASGTAVQKGLECLEWASIGITAPTDSLESLVKYFRPTDDPYAVTAEAFREFGNRYHMDRHLIKQFCAQFNLQAPITCALELARRGVEISRISSIDVYGHINVCGNVQGNAGAYKPQNQGAADHSTPFVIAIVLMKQRFDASVYEGEPWFNTDVLQLMSKIKLTIEPEFEQARQRGLLGCRIVVTEINGTTFTSQVTQTRGHPDNQLSDEQLIEKMNTLLTPIYGPKFGQQLWNACMDLIEDENVGSKCLDTFFQLIGKQP